MFKVSSASLQTFIIDTPNCVLEDRVQYSTVHVPNVFCDGRLQRISCVGIVLHCYRQVHRYFLIILYIYIYIYICVCVCVCVCVFPVYCCGGSKLERRFEIESKVIRNCKKMLLLGIF